MTPTHEEVAHEIGDGWTAVWDATEIPAEVAAAFDTAGEKLPPHPVDVVPEKAEDSREREAGEALAA